MTDLGLTGFDPRRARSERAFWLYVIGSVIAHVVLVTWLVSVGMEFTPAAPAMLVRLVNAGADEAGGGLAGGPGNDEPAGPAAAVQAALTQSPTTPAVKPREPEPAPMVSPIKDAVAPAPEPASDVPANPVALDPGAGNAPDGPATGPATGPSGDGPGGPGDGSGGPGSSGSGPAGTGSVRKGLPVSYTNAMLSRIKRNQYYPDSCRMSRTEGTVRVRVTVNSDGSVAEVKLAHSSGSEELDRAGMAAVQKTTFPPFPPGVELPAQRITVPLDFDLND